MPTPALSASNFGMWTSNTHSGESAASGPSPAADGYVGSFHWDWSTGGGAGTVEAVIVWEVSYTNNGTWQLYDCGKLSGTYAASSSGHSYIDFKADLVTGIPHGQYAITAYVCTGTPTNITGVLGGGTAWYSFWYMYAGNNTPPNYPQPQSGDDPPITRPQLPPSGPAGPGSTFTNY